MDKKLTKPPSEIEIPMNRSRWGRRGLLVAALGLSLAIEPIIGCGARMYNSADFQSSISRLLSGPKKSDAEEALKTASQYASEDTKNAMSHIPENSGRARILARKLKLPEKDALVQLNLAYGIAAIGESKTEELFRGLGIQYFLRYPRSTLEDVYQNLEHPRVSERPVLLVAFNKNDWNGHFYREGMVLEPLNAHYKVLITEVDGEDAFYSELKAVSKDYGKINTLIIAGHGAPGSIQLGENNEKGELDLSDADELVAVKDVFEGTPTIVLASCSTGQDDNSIGALLSRSWGANVFAPLKAITKTEYHLDKDGRLSSVTYDVESRQFAK